MRDSSSVLFVCLGNICRSPTAHGVFLSKVQQHGLSEAILVDSAGTATWHIGSAPDPRSFDTAAARGYDLGDLRARQVEASDFARFDYILAMDNENLEALQAQCPPGFAGHLGLFLEFAPNHELTQVPDPYYKGDEGFVEVLDLVEHASEGLLSRVCRDFIIVYEYSC